jgi:N-carbamoyl-L-amino-acid hydrolase
VAVANLVVRLDLAWKDALAHGQDLAVTIGQFETDPALQAFSKVSGEVHFSLDTRSVSQRTLDEFERAARKQVDATEKEFSVRFELGARSSSKPAALDTNVGRALAAASSDLEIPFLVLPSGAGHDCAVFADAGVPAGMVFMRNTGGSHNPDEALATDDLAAAARVVMRFLTIAADVSTSQAGRMNARETDAE